MIQSYRSNIVLIYTECKLSNEWMIFVFRCNINPIHEFRPFFALKVGLSKRLTSSVDDSCFVMWLLWDACACSNNQKELGTIVYNIKENM